jgi:hypothetical protein
MHITMAALVELLTNAHVRPVSRAIHLSEEVQDERRLLRKHISCSYIYLITSRRTALFLAGDEDVAGAVEADDSN